MVQRFPASATDPRPVPEPVVPLVELEAAPIVSPGMLLVGATGRNSGKTELVCSLVRRFGTSTNIAAAKVTTVSHGGVGCPRGGAGCGVCASLETPYSISEETGGPPGKDTVRMLEAGARPVLWLRARSEALGQGAVNLVPRLGPLSIVESNSLRIHVSPDLFLMVRGAGEEPLKDSAQAVSHMADVVIASDGQRFSPFPDEIGILHGRWVIRRNATAIVLAGGKSSRLGVNKALLPMKSGRTLIECVVDQLRMLVDQILISTNEPEDFSFLGLPMIADERPDEGPLRGIVSALPYSINDLNLVVSCDMPFVSPDAVSFLFRHVGEHDGCVLVTSNGRYHPLFALYRKRVEAPIREAMAQGRRRAAAIAKFGVSLRFVEAPHGIDIRNLNTPEDVEEWGREDGQM